jgi:uncharacterized protein (DUF1800 family)
MSEVLIPLESVAMVVPEDSRPPRRLAVAWQPVTRIRLDGYDLSATTWGPPHVRHLMSRAAFGVSVQGVKQLQPLTKTQIIDQLLANAALPNPPGDWVNEPYDPAAYRNLPPEQQQQYQQTVRQRVEQLRTWWLALMAATPFNLREKMTFFWHGHFTTELRTINLPQWLYMQNDTLRRHALGNFRDFLKAIYKDPAMLIYLDGARNNVRQPNENFARELLELFTMGVGNYTETDIKEAARAFTGWQVDSLTLTSFLNPRRHDDGIKTFFGKSGNFGGDDIIDIILEQPVTAEFICRKLYTFFVSREVDEPFVTLLADTFRQNNYEIKPVLRAIFESDHFYSDHAIAGLIKSPIELAVSNARMLEASFRNAGLILRSAAALNQDLMNPPNVAGWPGQRDWINPTTFITRNAFSETYVMGGTLENPGSNRRPVEFDAMAFARSFGVAKATPLVDQITGHLLRYPLDEATRDYLITVLVGSADPDDWSLDYPGAETQVKQFLVELMRQPEFQLT